MYTSTSLVACLIALTIASPVSPDKCKDKPIKLPGGQYIGGHDADTSTTTYYGIRFANAERFEFATPIDHHPSDTIINASIHGPACINFAIPPPYDIGFAFLLGDEPIAPQVENCLTLDVYVPDGGGRDLPVLFYTPGGGFLVGASYPYDMRPLVSHSATLGKPFIAVVINYRLGPLGFLNPSFAAQRNLGLLDQVEALKWVQKNIRAFGGSPDKVTIMGESAGAESAMHQLLWTDENLFRSAFLLSVPSSSRPFLEHRISDKDDLVISYAEACGCPQNVTIEEAVTCLRTSSVATLVNNSIAWEGSSTSIGGFVRANVFDTIRAGQFPKVPMMFSTCRDEGTSAAIGFKSNNDSVTSLSVYNLINSADLSESTGEAFLEEMLTAYPNDPALGCPYDGLNTTYGQPSQYKRMAAIDTDGTYTEAWVEYLHTFSRATPTWGIMFEQPIPGGGVDPALGVMHGSDLAYWFPTLLGADHDPRRFGQGELVTMMHGALAHFVNDGNPNSGEKNGKSWHWPLFRQKGLVASLNAHEILRQSPPPHRSGFDVIHKYLRPGKAAA